MAELYKSYAQALFELACEEEKEQQILNALRDFSLLIKESSEYIELLGSPALEKSERVLLIENAVADKYPELLVLFLKHMCEKGDMSELLPCVEEYEGLYSSFQRLSRAKIISAVELTEDEKKKIINKLEKITNKNIDAEYMIDTDILGGVIIETEDKIYDGSLRKKINDLKKVMKE